MVRHVALGIGGGLVSALLFAAVGIGSIPALALMYLAPLPILILALGWHHLVGLLALAVGGLATSLLLRPSAGIAFALGPAFASWGLAYLSLLFRPGPAAAPGGAPAGRVPADPWYPTGKLLAWIGVAGALIAVCALAAATGLDHDRYREILAQAAGSLLRREARLDRSGSVGQALGVPNGEIVRLLVAIAPALLGAMLALILVVNLWLAARVVAISGRLVRPWPDLPATRMPLAAVALLAGSVALAPFQTFAGVAAAAFAGGLSMAFALQGLALLHDISRGRSGRGLLLSAAYGMTLILGYVFLPAFALLGIADSSLPLRRALRPASRPPSPPPV